MNPTHFLRQQFSRIVIFSLLTLFLIPALTLGFVGHAHEDWNRELAASLTQSIETEKGLSPEKIQIARTFIEAHPASTLCANNSPEVIALRDQLCARYSPLWQFHVAQLVASGAVIGGIFLLLAILGMGAMAFVNRGAQLLSFTLGWRLLTLGCTAEVVAQGSLITWLTFWLPAWFFGRFSVYLLAVIMVFALIGMFMSIRGLFRQPSLSTHVVGQPVNESDAPALWKSLRELASRIGTPPPDNMIAGIDSNFFVTEAPLTVMGQRYCGRSLFVSIPLLRILSTEEADAVLSHELAHLRGGDAASSAALGPRLQQFDAYCSSLRSFMTIGFYFVMSLYRLMFELALSKESREREFRADSIAAENVSPEAITHSLIKTAAYAQYREVIESSLFDTNKRLDNRLGIATFIASGLAGYAESEPFQQKLLTAATPHPFDSHPLIAERMRRVGCVVSDTQLADIVTATPQHTWVNEILTAARIEEELWASYEERFATVHEQALAYRYEPATPDEEALVLKYFPEMEIMLKDGKLIQISYAGLRLPSLESILAWDSVRDIDLIEESFGVISLIIHHPEINGIKPKSTQIGLRFMGQGHQEFSRLLGQYWNRHRLMRQNLAAAASTSSIA